MAPPAFYLHGFASSAQSTKASYLGERLRPYGIVLHCPDFNQPDFTTLTLTRMLDRLDRELAAAGEEPAVLIGSSLGGTLAILAASAFGPRIGGLVLLAPAVMFAKEGHHLLPPERIAEWKRLGRLPFFHYADNAERMLNYAFYEDSFRYRSIRHGVSAARARVSGAARQVGRSADGRGIRAHAAQRDAVAARG